jgi:CHAT domain-containing protein
VYSLGDSTSYLWVVTSRNLVVHSLPPRSAIERDALTLRSSLTNPNPAGDADLVSIAASLYGTLLEPAGEALDDAKTVYIVPDGALHFIPFDVLLDDDPRPPDPQANPKKRSRYFSRLPYAFQKTNLYYGPSASALATLASGRGEQSPRADMAFLGVGDPVLRRQAVSSDPEGDRMGEEMDPLPHARDELETAADRFDRDERTVLLGYDAAEGTLVEPGYLSRYRILHFATHGLIDERRPEGSCLALSVSPDSGEDGYLCASEIYGLRVGADLVVLSACATGSGPMNRGEGLLSLPRSFVYAGAGQVLYSLWRVPDPSVSKFVSSFYKETVRKRRSKGESLWRAKKELRSNGPFSHPFHWARFVLMGAD